MNVSFNYALKAREAVTSAPKNYFSDVLVANPEDGFGGVYKFEDALSAYQVSLGTVAVGTVLYLHADRDVEVYLGDPATTTPIKTSFLVICACDLSNGFSELHIKNNNGDGVVASVDLYVAGDISG